jgi:uncharacterized RDD family membrane protein YckC
MIRYATFNQRLWAVLLDALVDLTMLGMLALVASGAELGGLFTAWWIIHHVGLVTEGGSIGHRLMSLRVVRQSGERMGIVQASVREISRLFVSLPPLGLGLLWMLDQPQRRCWHDIIGDSVVVHERSVSVVDAPAWAEAPPWRAETTTAQQRVSQPVPAVHPAPIAVEPIRDDMPPSSPPPSV